MYITIINNTIETGINAINGEPDKAKFPATNTSKATPANKTSVNKSFINLFIS
jgi:hypothetical protein